MCVFTLTNSLLTDEIPRKDTSNKLFFNQSPPLDLEKTNEIRRIKNIRLINKSWVFRGREFGCDKWSFKNGCVKNIMYKDDGFSIWSEYDIYSRGRTYKYLGPARFNDQSICTASEFLELSYLYDIDRFYISVSTDDINIKKLVESLGYKPMPQFSSSSSNAGYAGNTNQQTLKVADDILEKWGLQRIDSE